MSENSWPENASSREPEYNSIALNGLDLGEAIAIDRDPDSDYLDPFGPSPLDEGFEGRRLKAAFLLTGVWGTVYLLHTLTFGLWIVMGVSGLMAAHMLRAFTAKPVTEVPNALPIGNLGISSSDTGNLDIGNLDIGNLVDGDLDSPCVTLLVSAKNEEAVIEGLVRNLCALHYPQSRYELWVIDDASTDATAQILQSLRSEFPQLNVFSRRSGASGGKSGALNQVFPKTKGEFLVVFDADARISPDFLQKSLPVFLNDDRVGALQLRKAVVQSELPGSSEAGNFWIQGQNAEMLLDAFMQQQRIAIGGLGELRGNGQFIRRSALIECGGWNEETITDDLDLTFRLHLNQWDIQCLTTPCVYEEGVTRAKALWHQRNRWGEGGAQRYLDYWRFIIRNRMGRAKTIDLGVFWIMQYFMPTAAIPDFLLALKYQQGLVLTPLSILTFLFFVASTTRGIHRRSLSQGSASPNFFDRWMIPTAQALQGFVYMMHWFAIIATVTIRMAIVPKRLKWVKTVHAGH